MFEPNPSAEVTTSTGRREAQSNRASTRLLDLAFGDVARIASIAADQTAAKRLADMGFVRGAVVEMIRPGRPCLVRIGGTYVGLGLEHQGSVLIDRV